MRGMTPTDGRLRRIRAAGLIAVCLLPAATGCIPTGPYGNVLVGEVDVSAFDFWTGVHVVSGYILGDRLGDKSFVPTLAALVVWEVYEPDFWPGWRETPTNQAVDVVAGVAGWAFGR